MKILKLTPLIVLCLLMNLLVLRCDCSKHAELQKEEKTLMNNLKDKMTLTAWKKLEQGILSSNKSGKTTYLIQRSILENKRILEGIEEVEKSNFTALPEFKPGHPEVGLIGRIRQYAFELQGIDTNKPGTHLNIWDPALHVAQLEEKLGKSGQSDPLYKARVKNVLEQNKDNFIKVKLFLIDYIKLLENQEKQTS
jgi:hypothetical protein